MDKIEIPSQDMHCLEVYKNILNGTPQREAITLEDLDCVKKLAKELKAPMQEYETTFAEIQQINLEIAERMEKIKSLQESIDPRIRYIKESPVTQAIKNHNASTKYTEVTSEAVLKVLKEDLPYGGGNSQIAEKLGLENSKGVQNKIYSVCKALENEGLLKSENRLWKTK